MVSNSILYTASKPYSQLMYLTSVPTALLCYSFPNFSKVFAPAPSSTSAAPADPVAPVSACDCVWLVASPLDLAPYGSCSAPGDTISSTFKHVKIWYLMSVNCRNSQVSPPDLLHACLVQLLQGTWLSVKKNEHNSTHSSPILYNFT